jgi:hypothetical protein
MGDRKDGYRGSVLVSGKHINTAPSTFDFELSTGEEESGEHSEPAATHPSCWLQVISPAPSRRGDRGAPIKRRRRFEGAPSLVHAARQRPCCRQVVERAISQEAGVASAGVNSSRTTPRSCSIFSHSDLRPAQGRQSGALILSIPSGNLKSWWRMLAALRKTQRSWTWPLI